VFLGIIAGKHGFSVLCGCLNGAVSHSESAFCQYVHLHISHDEPQKWDWTSATESNLNNPGKTDQLNKTLNTVPIAAAGGAVA